MNAAIDQLWAWFIAGWAVLTSPWSIRIHALGFMAALLGASLYSARTGIKLVEDAAKATRRAWGRNRMGSPKTITGWLAKIFTVRVIYVQGVLSSIPGVLVSLACGVLLPALVLFAMVFAYPWFDASSAHLIDDLRRPSQDVGLVTAALFVADQTLRGGLFDLIEIFAVDVAQITNNPANIPFSMGLFAYHLYVEAFVFSGFVLFGYNAWTLGRQMQVEHKILRERYARFRAGATPLGADVPTAPDQPAPAASEGLV